VFYLSVLKIGRFFVCPVSLYRRQDLPAIALFINRVLHEGPWNRLSSGHPRSRRNLSNI
jgi:hypothetical protein